MIQTYKKPEINTNQKMMNTKPRKCKRKQVKMKCIQIVATSIIHLFIGSIGATNKINKMDATDDDENFRI